MSLRELTKEYLTKAAYHTPLPIMTLMAAALNAKEGSILDVCGGSEEFLLRAAAIKEKKGEEELLAIENWTGIEETSGGRENLLLCGPKEKLKAAFRKKEKEKLFDYVLMNPPFGYTKGEAKSGGTRLESQFLNQALNCLKESGRCAAIVPNGLLTRTSGEDQALRQRFVEECHVEQVILLPINSFLPFAEVRTGILIFSREKGDGITKLYDFRKMDQVEQLTKAYQENQPACVLNRTTLAQHQYILSSEEYLKDNQVDIQELTKRERVLNRRLERLLTEIPSINENETGQIGMFPCFYGIQNRRNTFREILDCEYGLLECELLKAAEKEKWPKAEGSTFLGLKSGKRWDDAEKDGPYRVYGAVGVQGTAKTPSMEEETAVLIGRVGFYCGLVYKAWTKGFVSDNVMLARAVSGRAEEDFLILLLKTAHFNLEKRGSVQPYITKDMVLKRKYPLPEPERQRAFLKKYEALFEKIREQEQEVEELSVKAEIWKY